MREFHMGIPVHGQWGHTKRIIERIAVLMAERGEAIGWKLNLVIVDNASRDATRKKLEATLMQTIGRLDNADYKIIKNERNIGVALSWNQILTEFSTSFDSEALCILNNDLILGRGSIGLPLKALCDLKQAGMVFPREISTGDSDGPWPHGATYEEDPELESTGDLYGPCFWMTRKTMEMVGFFDGRFRGGWYEDTDYWVRARVAGISCGVIKNACVHHFGSATIDSIPDFEKRYGSQNEILFKEKYKDMGINLQEFEK